MMKNKLLKQILKFGIVGGSGFVIDYFLMVFLTEAVGIDYLISSAISFSVSVVYNYTLSVMWVFEVNKENKAHLAFLMFLVLSIVGLGINQLLMWVLVDITRLGEKWDKFYMIAKLFVTGIVMVYNFITRKIFLEGRKNEGGF